MSTATQVRMKVSLAAPTWHCGPGDVMSIPAPLARAWVEQGYCEILESPVERDGGEVEAPTFLPAETAASPAPKRKRK